MQTNDFLWNNFVKAALFFIIFWFWWIIFGIFANSVESFLLIAIFITIFTKSLFDKVFPIHLFVFFMLIVGDNYLTPMMIITSKEWSVASARELLVIIAGMGALLKLPYYSSQVDLVPKLVSRIWFIILSFTFISMVITPIKTPGLGLKYFGILIAWFYILKVSIIAFQKKEVITSTVSWLVFAIIIIYIYALNFKVLVSLLQIKYLLNY